MHRRLTRAPARPRTTVRTLVLVSALAGACGDDDAPRDAASPGSDLARPSTGLIVAAEGGSLASADGRFTLDIPPGALAADTEMAVLDASESIEGAVGDVYDVEPDGTTFAVPATGTVQLSLLEVTDVVASEGAYPALYLGTSETGATVEELEGSEVVYEADGRGRVAAPVEHLSLFWAGGQRRPYGVNLGLEVAATQSLGGFEATVTTENRSGSIQYLRFRTSATGAVSAAGGGTAPTTGSTPLPAGGSGVGGTLAFTCDEEGEGEIRVHLGFGTLETSPETRGIEVAQRVVCRAASDGGPMTGRPTECAPPLSVEMELNEALQAYTAELALEPGALCDLDTPTGWRADRGPTAGRLVFRVYTAASPFGDDRHVAEVAGVRRLTVTAIGAGTDAGSGTWSGLPNGSDFTIDVQTDGGQSYRITARFDGTMLTLGAIDML